MEEMHITVVLRVASRAIRESQVRAGIPSRGTPLCDTPPPDAYALQQDVYALVGPVQVHARCRHEQRDIVRV